MAWSDGSPAVTADAGRLRVVDGKLIADTQRLISAFTIVQSHGKPMLVVEVSGKDGIHICAVKTRRPMTLSIVWLALHLLLYADVREKFDTFAEIRGYRKSDQFKIVVHMEELSESLLHVSSR